MKFLKYLVFIFSLIFSTYSFSAAVYIAGGNKDHGLGSTPTEACYNWETYNFGGTATIAVTSIVSTGTGSYTCHFTKNGTGDWTVSVSLYSGTECLTNHYAAFSGATASQADGTMCFNGCSVRTSSTSKISDYGSGGTVSIQYFCDVNFKNCSGVVKNTGGTCSGTTSGITFTDRGTAAPTQ